MGHSWFELQFANEMNIIIFINKNARSEFDLNSVSCDAFGFLGFDAGFQINDEKSYEILLSTEINANAS